MHYGFRARDECRNLCLGDLVLEHNPETDREILVWRAERGSKASKVDIVSSLILKSLLLAQTGVQSFTSS